MSDIVLKTIIAEAGGDPNAMAAVAAVIHNRAVAQGKTPEQIVKAKGQFEGYSNPGPASIRAQNDPKVVARASQVWSGVKSGTIADPTNGATMYHADYVKPYWAKSANKNGTVNIGGNIFYKGSGSPQTALGAIDKAVAPNPQSRPSALAYAPPVPNVRAITVNPNGSPASLLDALTAKYGSATPTPRGASGASVSGLSLPEAMPAPRVASLAPAVPQQLVSHPVQTVRIDPMTNKVMAPNAVPSLQAALNTKADRIASGQEHFTPTATAPPVIRPANTSSGITKMIGQAGNVALPTGVVPKSVQRDMAAISAMQANRSGSPDDRSSPIAAAPKPLSVMYPTSAQKAAINYIPGEHSVVPNQTRMVTPSPLLAFNGDQATGLPKSAALTAIGTEIAPPVAPVPHPYPIRVPVAPKPPMPSFPSQVWNAAGNVVNHSPVGHIAQFLSGKPVTGGLLSMLQGTPMQAAHLITGGVLNSPAVSAAPVGSSFLQAQGVDTSNMTAGQVANALNDSVRGAGAGQWH